MAIGDFYTTTFTVKRMVWSTDGSGNENAALSTVTTLSGHMQQASLELTQTLGLRFTKTFTIWCPLSTNVNEGDQLTAGGFTYTVKAKQTLETGVNKHIELVAERDSDQ